MDLDVRPTLAFLAVVEHGSFRGASRALGVPRSTLSQRVAALEERLGVQLLDRTTRSVRLTDAGALYRQEVTPALDALSDAEATITDRTREPTGQLRMTAPYELGQGLLGPVIGRYTARHPEVRVVVDLLDRQVNLVEEGYDLALRVGPLADSQLVARRLGEPQRIGLFASTRYLDREGRPASPSELDRHRCLVMTGALDPTRWSFRSGQASVKPTIAVNSFVVLRQLAEAGAGIARMPAGYASEASLEEVLGDFAPPGRPLSALYPRRRHPSAAVRAMLELLVEELG